MNRLVWYLDYVWSNPSFDEKIVKFRNDPQTIIRVAILTGLPVEQITKGIKLSQIDYFRNQFSDDYIEFLSKMNEEVTGTYLEIFARNLKINGQTYEDMVKAISQPALVQFRNEKPFRSGSFLENTEEQIRELSIRILATFFTPPGIIFAPSGRILHKERFLLDNNGGIHFIDLEDPNQNLIDIIEEIQFLQPVLENILDIFKKWKTATTQANISILLRKISQMKKIDQFTKALIEWIDKNKP